MKRFLKLAIGFGALGMSLSSASACVLGQSACRNGILWTCQRCGSETCEIMTGSRCHKDDLPDQHVDNASRFDIAQTTSTGTASGFPPRGRVETVTGGLPPPPPTPPSAPPATSTTTATAPPSQARR